MGVSGFWGTDGSVASAPPVGVAVAVRSPEPERLPRAFSVMGPSKHACPRARWTNDDASSFYSHVDGCETRRASSAWHAV